MKASNVHQIRINSPQLRVENAKARLSSAIEIGGEKQTLWYEIPEMYAEWFAVDRCDGFVVALLLQAMSRGDDLIVEGSMSSRLYHNLVWFFIPMMAKAFPQYEPVKIIHSGLLNNCLKGDGAATGFSGGVDSFAAIIQHLIHEESPDYKITHFLFHHVGAHGHSNPEHARQLFRQRFKEVQGYSQEVGIPLVPVDSNLVEILPIDFLRMFMTLNASVLLILQNKFARYFYASSEQYADCGVNKSDIIGRFDPFAFHLLSTESLACISTGGQLSRVEKTALVSSYEPTYRYLNVCIDIHSHGKNCSVCSKCCRTLLTLELQGTIHLYEHIFDLDAYRKQRQNYIRNVVMKSGPGDIDYEVVELARDVCNERWASELRRRKFLKEKAANIGRLPRRALWFVRRLSKRFR